jgi:gamma-glutamylcyclotransferase (GGCT)/AIG2-like uncharacterized protein YtfP
MLLFVYGTLRRGGSHHAELRDARFAGRARTQSRYDLVDLGGYPALLEGGTSAVSGELYEVDDALLVELDRFEEVPALYERKQVALDMRSLRRKKRTDVEAYLMRRERAEHAPRIASGTWDQPSD